ncbi:hypothetical protein [Hyphomicrobium sp.]|uniref:hypothetical protein n=1 Tax=Hyphomicrobium sp. TaxID=82 RepID=UPI002E348548|nr:hypothetical protein [Hyphomicrobium sp.]HEX2842099.1 hypothetical protein [Hyphomicrobium sp.]
MRQEEICTLLWADFDRATSLATVRNRKDPRRKSGNHQKVPLFDATGYDAIALLNEQHALNLGGDRVLPTWARSWICKSIMNANVVVVSTSTASTLLPRLILPSVSTAQVSASDFSRKQREAR